MISSYQKARIFPQSESSLSYFRVCSRRSRITHVSKRKEKKALCFLWAKETLCHLFTRRKGKVSLLVTFQDRQWFISKNGVCGHFLWILRVILYQKPGSMNPLLWGKKTKKKTYGTLKYFPSLFRGGKPRQSYERERSLGSRLHLKFSMHITVLKKEARTLSVSHWNEILGKDDVNPFNRSAGVTHGLNLLHASKQM